MDKGAGVVPLRLPHQLPFSFVRSPPHSKAACRLWKPTPVSASSSLESVVEEAVRLQRPVGAAVEIHLEAAEELVILAEGEGVTLVALKAQEEVE